MVRKKAKKFDTTFEADEAREKSRIKRMTEEYYGEKQKQEVTDEYWGQTWDE